MSIEQQILETGLKVVDLLAPYAKGGKIGNSAFYLPHFYQYVAVKCSCSYISVLVWIVAFLVFSIQLCPSVMACVSHLLM